MILHLLKTDGETNEFLKLGGKNQYVLGRDQGDLVLGDERCSRKHAMLFLDDRNRVCIRDLKSTNGTIVNKQRVPEAVLSPEDTFRVGRTIFIFFGHELEEGEADDANVARNTVDWNQAGEGHPAPVTKLTAARKPAAVAKPVAKPKPIETNNSGVYTPKTKSETKIPIMVDPFGDDSAPNLVDAGAVGSILLSTWPDNFRALNQEKLVNFIEHMDPDQKRKSRRLLELAKVDEKIDDAA